MKEQLLMGGGNEEGLFGKIPYYIINNIDTQDIEYLDRSNPQLPNQKYTQQDQLYNRNFIGYLPIQQIYAPDADGRPSALTNIRLGNNSYIEPWLPGTTPELSYFIRNDGYYVIAGNAWASVYKTVNPAIYYFKQTNISGNELIYALMGTAGYSFGNSQFFNNYYTVGLDLMIDGNLAKFDFLGSIEDIAFNQILYEQVSEISIDRYGVRTELIPIYPFIPDVSGGIRAITYNDNLQPDSVKNIPTYTADINYLFTLSETITSCKIVADQSSGYFTYLEVNGTRYELSDGGTVLSRRGAEKYFSLFDTSTQYVHINMDLTQSNYPQELT